jgi:hypothetical protein
LNFECYSFELAEQLEHQDEVVKVDFLRDLGCDEFQSVQADTGSPNDGQCLQVLSGFTTIPVKMDVLRHFVLSKGFKINLEAVISDVMHQKALFSTSDLRQELVQKFKPTLIQRI